MTLSVSTTESNIFTAVGNYLTAVLPPGTPVLQGQMNRVAEPSAPNFAVMWALARERIETNVDSYADALFEGSIAGTEMTITEVSPLFSGTIGVGSVIFGVGVAVNTVVTALGTASGGIGTYAVNNSQTVTSEALAAGTADLLQPTRVTVQVDVHGPVSGDNAQLVSTTFRDEFAVDLFATYGFDVVPLYSEDPRQMPFINAEKQFEEKWTVDLHLQANITVAVPQQFANAVALLVKSVDATFPPA